MYNIKIYEINLKKPKIGSKGICLSNTGVFILEKGPASLRVINIPHAGSAGLTVFDGCLDEDGGLPDSVFSNDLNNTNCDFNGRVLWRLGPVIMGAFPFDIGCHYGLIVRVTGMSNAVMPTITIGWVGE